jgi:5-methylcytosine-specific restriction protein A
LNAPGFCADHQQYDTRRKPWGSTKLTRQQRGYGAVYQKQRKMKLREEPFCQIAKVCVERTGHPAPATCVDHIVAMSNGGSESYDNLQSACEDCNQWKASAVDSKRSKAA